MTNITAIKGDITIAKVDAIVNAANPVMLGGGGVDDAIHQVAGIKLLEACMVVELVDGVRCPIGEARITEAGDLDAKYVIHTVGPRYNIDPEPEVLLASAYRSSLELALKNECQSIAFPAISCGVYGYPIEQAARISIEVCSHSRYRHMQIFFYLFQGDVFDVWSHLINELAV